MVLTLLPFLRRVFTLVLLSFGDDVSLLEECHSRSDTFLQVFLIDLNPVDIAGLLPNLDEFKNLLFIGL